MWSKGMKDSRQTPFIENLLVWRGLPNLFVIIGMIVSAIVFIIGLSYKEMQIEQEHQRIYQRESQIEAQTEDIQKQLNDYIANHK